MKSNEAAYLLKLLRNNDQELQLNISLLDVELERKSEKAYQGM